MNLLRHKHGNIAKQEQDETEREKLNKENNTPISEEEHSKRIDLLKNIGLLKG